MYGWIDKLMAHKKKQASLQELVSPYGMDLRIGYIEAVKHICLGWNRQLIKDLGNRCINERNDKIKINRHERNRN